MKNTKNKTRNVNEPYETYVNLNAGWEWRVLRHYQSEDKETTNPYARVFCAVKSPMTYDSWEMGDVYLSEIKDNAVLVN